MKVACNVENEGRGDFMSANRLICHEIIGMRVDKSEARISSIKISAKHSLLQDKGNDLGVTIRTTLSRKK